MGGWYGWGNASLLLSLAPEKKKGGSGKLKGRSVHYGMLGIIFAGPSLPSRVFC